jgi:hypothetical protein
MSEHKEPLPMTDKGFEQVIDGLFKLPNPNLASLIEDHVYALTQERDGWKARAEEADAGRILAQARELSCGTEALGLGTHQPTGGEAQRLVRELRAERDNLRAENETLKATPTGTGASGRARQPPRRKRDLEGHADVFPKINWIKNDPKKYNCFTDGSVFLVALQVTNNKTKQTKWEFDVIEADCDSESCTWRYRERGECYSSWQWGDFEYFALLEGDMPNYSDGENEYE